MVSANKTKLEPVSLYGYILVPDQQYLVDYGLVWYTGHQPRSDVNKIGKDCGWFLPYQLFSCLLNIVEAPPGDLPFFVVESHRT